MFFRGSRYETVPRGLYKDANGREIPYTLLRLIPDPPAIQGHVVQQGDRLDLIAFRYYDDPQQFWRICDGNRAMQPEELLDEVGRRLRIPLVQR
jgi:hypothetical protein